MKKYVIALLLVLSIFLASCGGSSGDDLSKKRLDITTSNGESVYLTCDEELASSLGLELLTIDVKELTESEEDNGNYYRILVAEDVKSSMVIYNYSLDDDFEKSGEKVKSVNYETLTFRNDLYSSEKEQLPAILFSEDNKLNDEYVDSLGLGFEMSRNAYWKKSFESRNLEVDEDTTLYTSVSLAYSAYKNGEDNVNFSVVYLPVNIKRFNNHTRCLDAYVLVPVYWSLTVYEEGVYKDIVKGENGYELIDTVLNDYKTVQLKFEEDGRLLNKVEETEE